ncbi:MAG: Alpha-D-ribose 1-methylphosphonate 5-triphosphate synthase subunit PhnG, partial [uncultured Acetobacteraceae bacterium]
ERGHGFRGAGHRRAAAVDGHSGAGERVRDRCSLAGRAAFARPHAAPRPGNGLGDGPRAAGRRRRTLQLGRDDRHPVRRRRRWRRGGPRLRRWPRRGEGRTGCGAGRRLAGRLAPPCSAGRRGGAARRGAGRPGGAHGAQSGGDARGLLHFGGDAV